MYLNFPNYFSCFCVCEPNLKISFFTRVIKNTDLDMQIHWCKNMMDGLGFWNQQRLKCVNTLKFWRAIFEKVSAIHLSQYSKKQWKSRYIRTYGLRLRNIKSYIAKSSETRSQQSLTVQGANLLLMCLFFQFSFRTSAWKMGGFLALHLQTNAENGSLKCD